MKYQEIYSEYIMFLRERTQIIWERCAMPKGNICKKNISGKDYYYLQYTSYGKKKTEYIRECEVKDVNSKIVMREKLTRDLESIDTNLDRLEKAAAILDENLSRTFFFLRQCADMDSLPLPKRTAALSFAGAMTTLEGLPASQETEQNLKAWVEGKKSFAEFYIPALRKYNILEGVYEG